MREDTLRHYAEIGINAVLKNLRQGRWGAGTASLTVTSSGSHKKGVVHHLTNNPV